MVAYHLHKQRRLTVGRLLDNLLYLHTSLLYYQRDASESHGLFAEAKKWAKDWVTTRFRNLFSKVWLSGQPVEYLPDNHMDSVIESQSTKRRHSAHRRSDMDQRSVPVNTYKPVTTTFAASVPFPFSAPPQQSALESDSTTPRISQHEPMALINSFPQRSTSITMADSSTIVPPLEISHKRRRFPRPLYAAQTSINDKGSLVNSLSMSESRDSIVNLSSESLQDKSASFNGQSFTQSSKNQVYDSHEEDGSSKLSEAASITTSKRAATSNLLESPLSTKVQIITASKKNSSQPPTTSMPSSSSISLPSSPLVDSTTVDRQPVYFEGLLSPISKQQATIPRVSGINLTPSNAQQPLSLGTSETYNLTDDQPTARKLFGHTDSTIHKPTFTFDQAMSEINASRPYPEPSHNTDESQAVIDITKSSGQVVLQPNSTTLEWSKMAGNTTTTQSLPVAENNELKRRVSFSFPTGSATDPSPQTDTSNAIDKPTSFSSGGANVNPFFFNAPPTSTAPTTTASNSFGFLSTEAKASDHTQTSIIASVTGDFSTTPSTVQGSNNTTIGDITGNTIHAVNNSTQRPEDTVSNGSLFKFNAPTTTLSSSTTASSSSMINFGHVGEHNGVSQVRVKSRSSNDMDLDSSINSASNETPTQDRSVASMEKSSGNLFSFGATSTPFIFAQSKPQATDGTAKAAVFSFGSAPVSSTNSAPMATSNTITTAPLSFSFGQLASAATLPNNHASTVVSSAPVIVPALFALGDSNSTSNFTFGTGTSNTTASSLFTFGKSTPSGSLSQPSASSGPNMFGSGNTITTTMGIGTTDKAGSFTFGTSTMNISAPPPGNLFNVSTNQTIAGTSMFGRPQSTSTTSMFGSEMSTPSKPFASGTNAFGYSDTPSNSMTAPVNNSAFSSMTNAPPPGTFMFGAQSSATTSQQPQSSPFQFGTVSSTPGFSFGQQQQQQSTPSFSTAFGGAQSNGFSQQPAVNGAFNFTASSTPGLGGFGSTLSQQPAANGNIFSTLGSNSAPPPGEGVTVRLKKKPTLRRR